MKYGYNVRSASSAHTLEGMARARRKAKAAALTAPSSDPAVNLYRLERDRRAMALKPVLAAAKVELRRACAAVRPASDAIMGEKARKTAP